MNAGSHPLEWQPPVYRGRLAALEPAITVAPGARLRIRLPDCDGLGPDGNPLPDEFFPDGPPANPAAGPIRVDGAEPGDALEVRIDSVEPDRPFGRTGMGDRQSLVPGSWFSAPGRAPIEMPAEVRRWSVEPEAGIARMEPPRPGHGPAWVIPLRPFPGLLATAPPAGKETDTLLAGDHGGNLDIPWLEPGATMWLPVWHPGGLLFAGDLHAAQGDGEFIGGAVEIGGWLTLRIDVRKGDSFPGPRFQTAEYAGAIGTGPDLHEAMKQACARLVDWLAASRGWDTWHTYHLVTQTGLARPGNHNTAACALPRDLVGG